MKFKCLISGCIYSFESDLDIAAMRKSLDYEEVPVEPVQPPVESTTVVPVALIKPAPAKPLPVAPKPTTAV